MMVNRQKFRHIDPRRLRRHPLNPRVGDVERIAMAIRRLGFGKPVVVWGKDGATVLRGWHASRAAVAVGMSRVPCVVVDCDERTAKRIILADNKIAERAGYDDVALAELLDELRAVEPEGLVAEVGYSADDLDAIIERAAGAADQIEELRPVFQVVVDFADPEQAGELQSTLQGEGFRCTLRGVKP